MYIYTYMHAYIYIYVSIFYTWQVESSFRRFIGEEVDQRVVVHFDQRNAHLAQEIRD